jgi:hypothetical protein
LDFLCKKDQSSFGAPVKALNVMVAMRERRPPATKACKRCPMATQRSEMPASHNRVLRKKAIYGLSDSVLTR